MTRRVTIAMIASADNDILQTRISSQQYARVQQLAAMEGRVHAWKIRLYTFLIRLSARLRGRVPTRLIDEA